MPQTTIVFDTHEAVHQLTAAGVPERQAEAHVRLQAQLIEQNFATKPDIQGLRRDTKAEFELLRTETKAEFKAVRAEMKANFEALTLTTQAVAAELRTDMGKVETQMAKLNATVAYKLNDHARWLIGAQIALAAIILAALKLF
ncbi:MAG: hypothetical protein OXQ29_22715 [Rhodospirillaceae bacterium]|nr:hypothetical protein [Rhodospirillaceae bacterium]